MTKDILGSEQIAYVFQSKVKDGSQPAFELLCTEAIEATRADANAINYLVLKNSAGRAPDPP